MSVPKQLCKKRLLKEYAELRSCPVAGCSAAPLENDILEWHANITTPRFQGIAFHFILKFPENYPKMPPKVVPQHYIKHQNVFGEYICLDILTMAAETETSPYRGWSNAYTVSSLLVQLQAFLFDVERVEDLAGSGIASYHNDHGINRMYREARNFKCTKCPHWGHKPFPLLDESANLNQPGFYKTLRPAVVRAGVEIDTQKVCEIATSEIVKVVKFDQHRACVALGEGVRGWCSKVTKNGVLLKRVFTAGPGVYKVNRKSEVAVGEEIVGNLPRAKYVDILKVFVMGDRLCGLVDLKHPSVVLKDKKCPYQQGEVYLVHLRFHEKFPSEDEEDIDTDDGSRLFVDDPNILDTLFLFCDPDTLHRICLVNPYFEKRIDRMKVLNEMNNRCYYTLKNMAEENTVLGVGLKSTIMDKRSRATGRKRPVLQQLHPTFDLLSAEAFYKHNCRTTVYKDCNFDSFLPLYINEAHGQRALPAAHKAIHELWKKEDKKTPHGSQERPEHSGKINEHDSDRYDEDRHGPQCCGNPTLRLYQSPGGLHGIPPLTVGVCSRKPTHCDPGRGTCRTLFEECSL
jgi:ubiquitin-protein ligase